MLRGQTSGIEDSVPATSILPKEFTCGWGLSTGWLALGVRSTNSLPLDIVSGTDEITLKFLWKNRQMRKPGEIPQMIKRRFCTALHTPCRDHLSSASQLHSFPHTPLHPRLPLQSS